MIKGILIIAIEAISLITLVITVELRHVLLECGDFCLFWKRLIFYA